MRFAVPAQYRRHIEAVVRRAVEEVRLDQQLRADADARVRGLAGVPCEQIDTDVEGEVVVIVR